MRLKHSLPFLLAVAVAGCESFLEVKPINEVPEEEAISDPISARAARAGLYDGFSDDSYYGGDFYFFGDLSADDVQHNGTFTTFRQADLNDLTADNGTIEAIWDEAYTTIGRANTLIAKLPGVPGLDPEERDQYLGEAYFSRALTFHNLVKLWGDSADAGAGVPLRLEPPAGLGEASQVARSTTGEVYAQIFDDLDQAEALMVDDASTISASIGAVYAIRARAHLYRENWAEAEAAAEAVAGMGYSLAENYADLFTAAGDPTDEDIFRIYFTSVEYNDIGYYYRARGFGGRNEVGPTTALLQEYDPNYDPDAAAPEDTYNPTDLRGIHNVGFRRGLPFGAKWPTGIGDEDIHVIRFAEILLIKAEAEARQGGAVKLQEAVNSLNPIRVRAGLSPLVYGVDVTTPQEVLDAILRERRLELAYEADRWPDLVRRGMAVTVVAIPEFQTLYPIPLNELDVAPNLTQNPGY